MTIVTLRLLVLGCTVWRSPMSSVSSRRFHGFQSTSSGRPVEWEWYSEITETQCQPQTLRKESSHCSNCGWKMELILRSLSFTVFL